MIEQMNARESFPLKTFSQLLDSFELPAGEFGCSNDWTLKYDLFSLASKAGTRSGSLQLSKAGSQLGVRYRKESPGDFLMLHDASITCRKDLLSAPEQWLLEFSQWTCAARVIRETPLCKSGRCKPDGMTVNTGRSVRSYPVNGPYSINWALLDAIQRMPRKVGFSTGNFTLFDHFDQMKPEQEIRFWKTTDVEFPRFGKIRMHAFEQIGRGILPIFYWLDERGCPLVVVSGIEGYLLKSVKGAAA